VGEASAARRRRDEARIQRPPDEPALRRTRSRPVPSKTLGRQSPTESNEVPLPQCKAKYRSRRQDRRATLRMKCRRCEHEIVVKGDLAVAESEPPPPRKQRRSNDHGLASSAGPSAGARALRVQPRGPAASPTSRAPAARGAGSARRGLSPADERRRCGASAAVGGDAARRVARRHPRGARRSMKRDELVRKIAAGAVTGESLCWREASTTGVRFATSPSSRRCCAARQLRSPATRPPFQGLAPHRGRATPPAAARPVRRGARRGRE